MSVRNMPEIRKWNVDGINSLGARLHETLSDIQNQIKVIAQQGNFNMDGNPAAPPALQGLKVTPHETGFDVAIQHDGSLYRGVHYYVDYADNPHFQNARTAHIGETRNAVLPLGPRKLYFQAWAKYPFSGSTVPIAFGSSSPQPVTGGTPSGLQSTQGCGTSLAGQQSYHQPAFRGSNPPVRTP
jgi:hypothetical protein